MQSKSWKFFLSEIDNTFSYNIVVMMILLKEGEYLHKTNEWRC